MADMDMRIKVSTEALISAASEAEEQVRRTSGSFDTIEETVKNSAYYWEGKGHDAYMHSYMRRVHSIRISLKRMKEHIRDLQKIAGVYETAEQEVKGSADELPVDVII